MSESKKLANLKAVLVRAWRERWSDTQWSIHSKRYITAHSTDASMLADLLLSQALVGLSGNHLILSYFKHAISSQLIPYMVGIESIVKFDDVGKVYCVKAIMELVLNIVPNIGMKGNFEDSWKLVKASLMLLKWTVVSIQKCLYKVQDNTQSAEYCTVIGKASQVLTCYGTNQAVLALLHIAHLDESDTFKALGVAVNNVREMCTNIQCAHLSNDELLTSLNFIDRIGLIAEQAQPILECHYHMLNPSVNVLLHFEATLNSTNEIPPVVEQLLLIEKLQGIERSDLYCEILRSGYMGMINSVAGPEELKWAAFVFLKIPQIFLQMTTAESPNTDVEQGLNKFLHYVPLLNLADSKCGADCLQLLVNEFRKHNVVTETVQERVMLRRREESKKLVKPDQPPTQQASAGLILRAEPTVTSILKTLDADYSKNQEGLFGVLGHMMSGKSFELILTAAAATGKLHAFATELIKFNEFARTCTGETGRQANTRSLLFDTSFLMLCHIAQTYGLHVFSSLDKSTEESFFVQWATVSLPEDGQYKSLDLLPPPDDLKVEALMQQFKPGTELKASLTKWNEVCHNAPFAMREILNAWEYGVLGDDTVKSFLNNVKSKMCCLPVVIASYLSSYVNMVEHDLRARPISMLETLMETVAAPDLSTNTYFQERSNLMQLVVSKIIQGVLPQSSDHKKHSLHLLPPTKPIKQMLLETWKEMFERGCICNLDLLKFEHLLSVGGVNWFCDTLVKEAMTRERAEDLYKGVCLLYSLFSLDLHSLALSLLHQTLPGLLTSYGSKLELLSGLRGVVLARLCIMLVVLVQRMKAFRDSSQSKKSRKRTRAEIELEEVGGSVTDEFDIRPSKMRRITDSTSKPIGSSFSSTDVFLTDDGEDSLGSGKEPLNIALANLFKLFNSIVVSDELSQRTSFVQSFVREMIKCDTNTTAFLAQFIPPNMISQLLRTMPSQFNFDVILSMCNLTNVQGRRIAAKVICQNERLRKEIESPSVEKKKIRSSSQLVKTESSLPYNFNNY